MRALLAMVLLLPTGCLDSDGPADDAADSGAGDGATGGTQPEPYYACADPGMGCEANACLERTLDTTDYHVCVSPCADASECPPVFAGNAPPACTADGECVIECNPGAAVCPSGTTCVDGDPPACMWPVETPGASSAAELCQIACTSCNAGVLLDWGEDDCEGVCLEDLQSCDGEQLGEVLVCPQDDGCSVGGLMFRSCAQATGCIGD